MFNDTQNTIINTKNLANAFNAAADDYISSIINEYGPIEGLKKHFKIQINIVSGFKKGALIPNKINSSFVDNIVGLTSADTNNIKKYVDAMYSAITNVHKYTPKACHVNKHAISYIIMHMWANGHIIPPLTFKSFKTKDALGDMTPELLKWCRQANAVVSDRKSDAWSLEHSVTRWLTSTNWLRPEDVNIKECVRFHEVILKVKSGKMGFDVPAIGSSTRILLAQVLSAFPERVTYNNDDLKLFDKYFALRLHKNGTAFEDTGKIVSGKIEEKKKKESDRKKKVPGIYSAAAKLNKAETDSDAEYIIYKKTYQRNGFFPDISDISFINNLPEPSVIELWSGLMNEWVNYRKESGLYADRVPIRQLRVLADYLSIVIPVSAYFDKSSTIKTPTVPNEFKRYPFMARRGENNKSVPTFKEFIHKRFGSAASMYGALSYARMFFDWLEKSYGEDEFANIVGPAFNNPIIHDDLPPQTGKKTNSTNKRPFSRHTLPHIINWLYAAEDFGIYLQETKQHIKFNERGAIEINPADYGFNAKYEFMGISFVINKFPGILYSPQIGFSTPSMTVLRMIILSLETGIRLQSSQWLCKNKWDQYNYTEDGRDTFILYVNTNKGSPAFTKPIMKRVRDLLLREQSDQNAFGVADIEIMYEDHEPNPYEPLVPLFKNIKSHHPFADKTYDKTWTDIMVSFQNHYYNCNIGHNNELFVTVQKPTGSLNIKYDDGNAFCPLNLVRVYTPHSCRSTFINRNASHIDIGDIAKLVGHANTFTTSTYYYGEIDDVNEKINYAHDSLGGVNEIGATIKAGPAYIKSQDINSALSKGLAQDREEAIRAFGIISLEKSLSEDSNKNKISAIDILKSSKMSQIKIRSTHICPVGEHCPEEVISKTGGTMRCWSCPIACKSIDHIPAISAKINELTERIKYTYKRFETKQKKSDPESKDKLWDALSEQTDELIAWKFTEDLLWRMKDEIDKGGEWQYHVEMPDMIRDHLTRAVEETDIRDFILKRIIESNEYPTMETPEIRIMADKIKRKILAGADDSSVFDVEHDAVNEVASILQQTMKMKGLSISDISKAIDAPLLRRDQNPLIEFINNMEEK